MDGQIRIAGHIFDDRFQVAARRHDIAGARQVKELRVRIKRIGPVADLHFGGRLAKVMAVIVVMLMMPVEHVMSRSQRVAVAAIIVIVLIAANRVGVRHPAAYALLGVPLWLAFFTSGVHATIAGVVLAMVVPARTRIDTAEFLESSRRTLDDFDLAGEEGSGVMTNEGQQAAIQALEHNCEAAQAPLLRMEHSLQPWVAFFIIPLFALANAGVHIDASTGSALTHVVTLGVVLGLVLGKPIGITLFAWLAVRLRVAVLPASVGWRQIHAVSWLGGIGFTMSLFVAGLAFGEGSELLDAAKIGILTASVLAAAAGGVMLHLARDRGHPAEAGPPTPSQ
jgi:NhaA family Na+:H+ antiporter